MRILVINAGSSSLKYQLFDMKRTCVMTGGVLERIGEKTGSWTHAVIIAGKKEKWTRTLEIKDHKSGMHLMADQIIDPATGVIDDISNIDAIGHRVVQGGESFGSAILIDDAVKKAIQNNNALAPLHNPPNLVGIEMAQQLFAGIPNIAVFDTQFHQTMPPRAFHYALPYDYYSRFKVRKYGFHGTSHKYISHQAAGLLGKEPDQVNLITLHLGNGCSISAVENGRCIDTSMGMTPLAGIMMGTRTGDIDPAIIGYLMKQTGMDIKKLDAILNKESGMKGICGMNDMRDIHKAAARGDQKAALAVEMFCYQIKKHIGAYAAVLGHVDAIILTAGVGENDDIIRAKICENLSCIGIEIDSEKNSQKPSGPFSFHNKDSRVQVWVIPANEELQIAKEVMQVIK